jgi:hypothetical protein
MNLRFLGVFGTKKAGAPKDPGQEVRVPRSVGTQERKATIPEEEEGAMDFKEIARQAEEMVAAGGQQADTEAVQKLAKTLNISPELARYLMALEVRIRKLEGI